MTGGRFCQPGIVDRRLRMLAAARFLQIQAGSEVRLMHIKLRNGLDTIARYNGERVVYLLPDTSHGLLIA